MITCMRIHVALYLFFFVLLPTTTHTHTPSQTTSWSNPAKRKDANENEPTTWVPSQPHHITPWETKSQSRIDKPNWRKMMLSTTNKQTNNKVVVHQLMNCTSTHKTSKYKTLLWFFQLFHGMSWNETHTCLYLYFSTFEKEKKNWWKQKASQKKQQEITLAICMISVRHTSKSVVCA